MVKDSMKPPGDRRDTDARIIPAERLGEMAAKRQVRKGLHEGKGIDDIALGAFEESGQDAFIDELRRNSSIQQTFTLTDGVIRRKTFSDDEEAFRLNPDPLSITWADPTGRAADGEQGHTLEDLERAIRRLKTRHPEVEVTFDTSVEGKLSYVATLEEKKD